ncbi:chromate efflux transporter [Algicella marina]|uniref:Chromate efflux transporter n=1 Tax=Algicella marina TaxID=2683284 RepID=A0A6P1SVR2_9RHOB|nr:chromate efflux transporter [Algicella marina]QHQ33750.1 chromate efflux transporter [Algicella marina]
MSEEVGLRSALSVYLRIGLLSFGGPAGQIALMQEEIVERKGWVSPEGFQRGLNVAMLLPGPEAQQLATWLGWRLHGVVGGLAAGLAFIVPGAILMILLAWIAARFGDVPFVAAIFYGIQPAVLVLVLRALWAVANRALTGPFHWALAGAAFLGLWAFGLPFPLIVALAALAGWMMPHEDSGPEGMTAPVDRGYLMRIVGGFSAVILLVFLGFRFVFGPEPLDGVATLFTSAAFVSFGGAYALLPYVAERAVETYGWLTAAEMLNGLAIAEATPGPLILVNVYAGFFAGYDMGLGVLTASLACFYTFAPSFMLILAVAPYVEVLQKAAGMRRALVGVSAAVVGVILNLTVYLGQAAFLPAGWGAPEWPKILLFAGFVLLAFWRKIPILWLIGLGVASGLLLELTSTI